MQILKHQNVSVHGAESSDRCILKQISNFLPNLSSSSLKLEIESVQMEKMEGGDGLKDSSLRFYHMLVRGPRETSYTRPGLSLNTKLH